MIRQIIFNVKQYLNELITKSDKISSFLRFGMIGVINTIHYYIWYLLFLYLNIPYIISHTIAFSLSMIGSYFLNCYFTFKTKPTLKKFIKYPLTTLTNYLISTFSLVLLVKIFHISSSIAVLWAAILPIPITFLVTKHILKNSEYNSKIKVLIKSKFLVTFKYLSPIIFLLLFSLGCHLYALYLRYRGFLFGVEGTDSILQFIYFVPFIQKSFLSHQPFWSWSCGLGGDVFGQFSYYYTTSPFFYLMLFLKILGIGSWTLENTLQWKLLFSILKQFLSMYFLYILLKYEKKKTYTSLIGAMIYGGCINYMWFSLFFDFMADAYIWIPLTILGFRIYNKTGKWFLFVISASLTVANSFYFGFISYVFYIIFIIIFIKIDGNTFKDKVYSFFYTISKYALFAIMSLGLAAVSFIPSVYALLKTDRFSNVANPPILYNSNYILKLPEKLFFYDSSLGFPLITLIIFALPWNKLSSITKRKTILAGIFFILYLTPYSGSFFNGFSYSCNRWFYLFIFSIAYAVPDWLEENDKLKNLGFHFFSIITILIIYFYYTKSPRGSTNIVRNLKTTKVINSVILVSGLVSFFAVMLKKYISNFLTTKVLNYIVVLCVAIALICNTNTYLYIIPPNMTDNKLQGSCIDNLEEKTLFNKYTPSNNEFYRTIFRDLSYSNAPMSYNYYGTSIYNSMINGVLHKWLKIDYNILNPVVKPSTYENFDDRLFLETAFGVKYLVTNKANPYKPSYGYVINNATNNCNIYSNKYNVGFDLWYTNTISRKNYDKMNIAERDSMLLQAAMVDEDIPELTNSFPLDNVTTKLPLKWENAITKNAKYKNGILKARKNASISIPIKNNKEGTDGEILFSLNLKPTKGQKFILSVNGKTTKKMEENYPYIYPLNKFTFKLNNNTTVIKIDISEGDYIISDAHAWFNSYKYYTKWVNERNKYNLKNLYVNGGEVKGNIKNNEKGILALNIPFCKGWSAKVDGEKQDLIKVNGILTGLVLEPGSHNIELKYITPGLIPGACLSIVFFIIIIVSYILKCKHNSFKGN
ncbi:polysaccharide synthesis protein GtrA [Clostridium botulinum]|uniref:Polysaccharide synthesis protein GtrA n=1 Tax=Clostridium botulinum TaxID=1491 RepID=A0ABC8CWI7_CLOBO|nr:GtrA family protein [Clostridium botulinum]AVQ39578.1 polysaccharide synthesis protein GtrA [Clostridium botulinum]